MGADYNLLSIDDFTFVSEREMFLEKIELEPGPSKFATLLAPAVPRQYRSVAIFSKSTNSRQENRFQSLAKLCGLFAVLYQRLLSLLYLVYYVHN